MSNNIQSSLEAQRRAMTAAPEHEVRRRASHGNDKRASSYDPANQRLFMGRTYLFECFRCGYRAWVSGGAGAGEYFAVQTIVCADCKELYDAVTEFKATASPVAGGSNKTAPKFAAVLNRLPPRGARPRLKFKPACPVSPLHRVRVWNRPDKCPKCGTFMEQNGLPFRLWD